ncbi:MAG: hypothetical protein WDO68_06260 [Gammaproteobacteria bacterium]
MISPTPEQLRSLLLHRLPEDEAQRLEEQLMQDADVADLLQHERTDLVDDYALGRLGADERAAFERHLLVDPVIRQRVKVARALHDIASRRADEPRLDGRVQASSKSAAAGKVAPWNRWPVRAAAVFVVCAVAVAVSMRVNKEADVAPPATAEQPLPQPAVDALDTGPSDVTGTRASIVLLADLQRGGEARIVRVAPGAGQVRLQAETTSSDSSLSYRLAVTDESGARLFSAEDLRPIESGGYVFVEALIPGAKLGTGRRTVTLEPQAPGVESFTWQVDVRPPPN